MLRALAVMALTGCNVSVTFDDTSFTCVRGPCPDGYQCVDGVCTTGSVSAGTRRRLSIDNAAGAAPLLDFPLPVRLAPEVTSGIAVDGADLRFTDLDGNPLAHQIETWNPAGESLVWVKIPRIDPVAVGAELFLIHGEPGATSSEDAALVWSDYHAVYHLDDTSDSSPSGFDGVNNGTTVVDGVVGPARHFDGSGQNVDLGTERPFARAQSQLTVSAWARLDVVLADSGVVFATSIDNAGVPTNTSRFQLLVNVMGELEGLIRTAEGGASGQVFGPVLELGRWLHLAFVADLEVGSLTLYMDGVEIATTIPGTLETMTTDTNSTQTVIGHGETFSVDAFFGDIDEVRLVHIARDADWIAAVHRSMAADIVTIGDAEPID